MPMALLVLVLSGAAPMTMTTIAKGHVSAIDEPRQVVVCTAEDWAALWKAHGAPGEAPEVDFATHMVVGVFLGTRSTGGYAVEIVDVVPADGKLRIDYVERKPARDMMVTQMLTSPFHLVLVPRAEGTVEFTPRTESRP